MANERGSYGKNGVSREGIALLRGMYGAPRMGAEIYVEQLSSTWKWIVGAMAVGGAVLWARHTSAQIGQLYAKTGLSREGFVHSLRTGVKQLPGRTRAALRGFARPGGEP